MDKRQGNSFWKLRSKHGADLIFATPAKLWEAAEEYFEYCENNPLQEEHVFATGTRAQTNKLRAFTLKGLFFFLGIGESTWRQYRLRQEFTETIERIEQVIWDQKFSGAAAGLLNPSIISRELGLVDQQNLQLSKGPEQRDYSALTDEEINQLAYLETKLLHGKKDQYLPGSLSAPEV